MNNASHTPAFLLQTTSQFLYMLRSSLSLPGLACSANTTYANIVPVLFFYIISMYCKHSAALVLLDNDEKAVIA